MAARSGQPGQQSFGHAHPMNDRRPGSQPTPMSQPPAFQRQYSGTFMPSLETGVSPVRSGSADPFGYPGYNVNAFGAQQQNYAGMPYQQMTQQSQYQGYGAGAPRSASAGFPPPGFNSYGTPPSTIDTFRMQNQAASPVPYSASPVMSAGVMPQGFNQNMPNGMYGFPQQQQQQQYFYSPTMQPVHTAGRGRRVSRDIL
jgi:hypothetical protein